MAMEADPELAFMGAELLSEDYSKQITLDLSILVLLADRPSAYKTGSYYEDFDYVLPTDFIKEGNP
jgi:hypothetical protein